MHVLTEMIRNDMKPALGVTEPGAIAYAVATAKKYCGKCDRKDDENCIRKVILGLNSGMFKNAFTCGIPGSLNVGNEYAAALGAAGADSDKGLECLEGITEEQAETARQMVQEGMIEVRMMKVTSRIIINATVISAKDEVTVVIRDSHTNIAGIIKNGEIIYAQNASAPNEYTEEYEAAGINLNSGKGDRYGTSEIHKYTLKELYYYAASVSEDEISFIGRAFEMNLALLKVGLLSDRTTYGPYLLKENGGRLVSDDEQATASLMCNGAIEARVLGLSAPAMSITGSGAHGIIATMPLYAAYRVNGYSEEQLLRATALSFLVCMYIKEYSGKLSAFCGCAIAAGTGMACGLTLLKGGNDVVMKKVINNMTSSITGMICDGGNQGCTMKGVVAVDAAFRSVRMAMNDVFIDDVHGINGRTPEETMRYMGMIASPGMVGTEKTIIDILKEKTGR